MEREHEHPADKRHDGPPVPVVRRHRDGGPECPEERVTDQIGEEVDSRTAPPRLDEAKLERQRRRTTTLLRIRLQNEDASLPCYVTPDPEALESARCLMSLC